MFYDIYAKLCAQNGISESKAAESIGLNRSAVVKWKRGAVPGGPTIQKLASFFGVSVDYLLEGEAAEAARSKCDRMPENPDIRMISRASKKMTPEQAENLRKYAQFMFPEAFEDDCT